MTSVNVPITPSAHDLIEESKQANYIDEEFSFGGDNFLSGVNPVSRRIGQTVGQGSRVISTHQNGRMIKIEGGVGGVRSFVDGHESGIVFKVRVPLDTGVRTNDYFENTLEVNVPRAALDVAERATFRNLFVNSLGVNDGFPLCMFEKIRIYNPVSNTSIVDLQSAEEILLQTQLGRLLRSKGNRFLTQHYDSRYPCSHFLEVGQGANINQVKLASRPESNYGKNFSTMVVHHLPNIFTIYLTGHIDLSIKLSFFDMFLPYANIGSDNIPIPLPFAYELTLAPLHQWLKLTGHMATTNGWQFFGTDSFANEWGENHNSLYVRLIDINHAESLGNEHLGEVGSSEQVVINFFNLVKSENTQPIFLPEQTVFQLTEVTIGAPKNIKMINIHDSSKVVDAPLEDPYSHGNLLFSQIIWQHFKEAGSGFNEIIPPAGHVHKTYFDHNHYVMPDFLLITFTADTEEVISVGALDSDAPVLFKQQSTLSPSLKRDGHILHNNPTPVQVQGVIDVDLSTLKFKRQMDYNFCRAGSLINQIDFNFWEYIGLLNVEWTSLSMTETGETASEYQKFEYRPDLDFGSEILYRHWVSFLKLHDYTFKEDENTDLHRRFAAAPMLILQLNRTGRPDKYKSLPVIGRLKLSLSKLAHPDNKQVKMIVYQGFDYNVQTSFDEKSQVTIGRPSVNVHTNALQFAV